MFELVRLMFTDVRVFVTALFFAVMLGPIVVFTFLFVREMWRDLR